ncbi:MAG: hypothetical protein K2X93_29055 [Candidatus Obscuribacterales bacterium]|nr:hypothetical protein [Candidatus Obscuribacterales bacterium]
MFEFFTAKAIHVIMSAQSEAMRLRRNYVGNEMILVGFLLEGTGIAARALNNVWLTLEDAQAAVERIFGLGNDAVEQGTTIPFTPRSKHVLELAWNAAKTAGHNYIGTAHLILGVIQEAQSNSAGPAAKVLSEREIDLAELLIEVQSLMESYAQSVSQNPSRGDGAVE